MPNPICDPFASCLDLDGRLLISRTAEGPSLAQDPADIPLGDVVIREATLHPWVRLLYQQTWTPQEACYGPIRSVIGLAPGETMTTEFRFREQVDYARLVQEALESATVSTHTEELANSSMQAADDYGVMIALSPWVGVVFGSFFLEDIGKALVGTVEAVVDFVLGGVGSILNGGGMHPNVQDAVDTVLDTVETFERKQTITETSYSRSHLLERAVTRTLTNPYRDRGLELRFIPVFRKFKVVTTLWHFHYGVLVKAGSIRFPAANVAARYGDFIQRKVADPRILSIANVELGLEEEPRRGGRGSLVADHLNANSVLYTRRYLAHLQERGDLSLLQGPVIRLLGGQAKPKGGLAPLARVLQWNKLHVRGNNIHVPLIDLERAVIEMKLQKAILDRVKAKIPGTIAKPAWLHQHTWTRTVHLYMGTIVEPAAGACILTNLPAGPGP
ncbi:MAG: hypothetical protein ACREJ6_06580 [Candidatus Methylomirabilis sp.]